MADDPDLTGRVRLDLTPLINGLRFAQAVTRRQIRNLVRDANRSLSDLDTDGIRNRLSTLGSGINLSPLVSGIGRAVAAAGRLAVPFAAAGAAVGSLVPLLAGVASALAQIAPAAGLAATGVISVGLAVGALKIGMMGVGDALKNAFDPESAEAYAESVKKLAPNARSFVETIRGLGPQFGKLKLRVQQNLFEGLGKTLKTTAKAVGPDLSFALTSSAGALNRMGRQVLNTATGLSKSGALGKALDSATVGLHNMSSLPATIVQGLTQVGAAAGPAFERLTAAGGGALERLSQRLTNAFESGSMEKAIEEAIDLLGQLGRVIGNVGGIFGNLFSGMTQDGAGLFSTLEKVTQALQDATGSTEFQSIIQELVQTMGVLGEQVGPLFVEALGTISGAIETLAPVARELFETLGPVLLDVMESAEEPLLALADSFGKLVEAAFPVVELLGGLLAEALPSLTPLFETLGRIIEEMTPFIQQLAENIGAQLTPILRELPGILEEILPVFERAAAEIFPALTKILEELSPHLSDLGEQLADLAVQLAPVVADFLEFSTVIASKIIPYVGPFLTGLLIGLISSLNGLAMIVEDFVLPALRTLGKILTGDLSGALKSAGVDINGLKGLAGRAFNALVGNALVDIGRFASGLHSGAQDAARRLYDGVQRGVQNVRTLLNSLPGIARSAAGALGGALVAAGASLISGLISGIESKIGAVRSKLGELTSMIPDWKGPARKDAKLLTPAGKSIIQGLIDGIDASTAKLKSKLSAITNTIERAISINSGNRKKVSGLGALLDRVERDNRKLLSLAKSRDKIAGTLKAAQKKLDDLIDARQKKSADIRGGILSEGNITSGMGVVNSVSAITIGLQQAVAKAKEFGANLAKLKAAKLRPDLLDDIANAGVSGGAATAEALAKATPAELKRINELQSQLNKAAGQTGTTVAGALYNSGIQAAQGLVDGLKSKQGAIERQMKKIAEAMLKAIRKALDMHSPSRKLRAVASLAMEGMPQGFEAMRARVARSAASVANAAVSAAQGVASVRPSLPHPGQLSAAYAGMGGVGGDTTNNFYLQDGDATPDGILHALSWRGLVGRRG